MRCETGDLKCLAALAIYLLRCPTVICFFMIASIVYTQLANQELSELKVRINKGVEDC